MTSDNHGLQPQAGRDLDSWGWDNPDAPGDDERMRFLVHLRHFMQGYSAVFDLHPEKLLPDTQRRNCKQDMISMMNRAGCLWVWETVGKPGLSPEKAAYIEGLRKAGAASFSLGADGLKRAAP